MEPAGFVYIRRNGSYTSATVGAQSGSNLMTRSWAGSSGGIAHLRARILVGVGATPTQRLTGRTDGILKLRGKWFDLELGQQKIPLLATLHPAYLLRQPAQKRLAWCDLLALRSTLDAH